jgi:CDP-alcohol phosphatidyltransferase-like enzyme
MNLRRVLILADKSADWMVAGLRQLDRLALSLDEFAVENKETSPIHVCIFWRPDLDPSQRWIPDHPRLTHVAFVIEPDDEPYDLVLTTRLFAYRKAIVSLFSERLASPRPTSPDEVLHESAQVQKHVPASENEFWENHRRAAESLPVRPGAWEFIPASDAIEPVEKRFLRASGKSQDGFVSRYLNRPISRALTRLLLQSSITPNAWTWLIFPIPIIAALLLARGSYWSFVCGLVLFQVFSVLDGCDGEIARAKFMESESGRRLDDLFDVLSNILLVLGIGLGLGHAHDRVGGLYFAEGIVAAVLIALNEWFLARAPMSGAATDSLGRTLYPRHRALVERSGLLAFGEKFASLLIQFTKRDVAVLFFVVLAAIGIPALILHLLLVVTALSLVLALRAR